MKKLTSIHIVIFSLSLFGLMFYLYDNYFDIEDGSLDVIDNEIILDDGKSLIDVKNSQDSNGQVVDSKNRKKTIDQKNKKNIKKQTIIRKEENDLKKENFIIKSNIYRDYESNSTNSLKTIYFIRNILNENLNQLSKDELKTIGYNLLMDLENNFPEKTEYVRYSYCCSKKNEIKFFLKNQGFNISKIELLFNEKCP